MPVENDGEVEPAPRVEFDLGHASFGFEALQLGDEQIVFFHERMNAFLIHLQALTEF